MSKSPRKLPAVCILYGLAEGPAHSRLLRELLKRNGFSVTTDAQEADILLSHSGGYLCIPADHQGKLLLLIGPSNGYLGKSLFLTQLQKVGLDLHYCIKHRLFGAWVYKSFWHIVYLLGKQGRNSVMLRGSRRLGKLLPQLDPKLLAVVLYRNDPWSWHGDRGHLLRLEPACLISHPGLHDDLWTYPDQYVAILQYLYETRILARSNQRQAALS